MTDTLCGQKCGCYHNCWWLYGWEGSLKRLLWLFNVTVTIIGLLFTLFRWRIFSNGRLNRLQLLQFLFRFLLQGIGQDFMVFFAVDIVLNTFIFQMMGCITESNKIEYINESCLSEIKFIPSVQFRWSITEIIFPFAVHLEAYTSFWLILKYFQ